MTAINPALQVDMAFEVQAPSAEGLALPVSEYPGPGSLAQRLGESGMRLGFASWKSCVLCHAFQSTLELPWTRAPARLISSLS